MSTELLSCVEINPSQKPTASVIWLHGLGADGYDFVDIVPQLNLLSAVRFVFPHAPVRPVTINNGYAMRAWYDVLGVDFNAREDESGVRESEKSINALIENEHRLGVPYHRIVLAGFSQGGAMALHCGLRYPEELAGIMALSTYLPIGHKFNSEASSSNTKIPIFMAHGTQDSLLPLQWGQFSADFLLAAGYQVEFHTYAMQHSVCAEEIVAIGTWLRKILP